MARRFLSAIKLLTGSTPPAGTAGDTFFDTDTKTIQVHDGTAWINSAVQATDGAIGGRVFTGDTAPSSPVIGDIWIDSTGTSSDFYTQAQSDARYTLQYPVTNEITSTTYTLVLGDVGEYVEMNNASANTLTVPPNSSVAFPIGTQVTVIQTNAGTTTIAPGSGVTINYFSPTSAGTRTLKARWAAATLIKRATDTWVLIGNLT